MSIIASSRVRKKPELPVGLVSSIEADGGIVDSALMLNEYRSLPSLVRQEAETLLIAGAYKTSKIYGFNPLTAAIVPFTFSRAGTATYFDKDGIIQTAAAGVPRIDYDPFTKECKGYLQEAASTNFINNNNVNSWTKSNCSVIDSVDPKMGTVQTVTATAAANALLIYPTIFSGTEGTSLSRSVYLKAGSGVRFVSISTYDGTATTNTEIDLVTGAVREVGVWSQRITSYSENIGNGWWRLVTVYNHNTSTGLSRFRIHAGTTAYNSVNAIGDYFYVAYPQAEGNINRATSIIATNGSQVTRVADGAFSSVTELIPYSEASIFMEMAAFTFGSSVYSVNGAGQFWSSSSVGSARIGVLVGGSTVLIGMGFSNDSTRRKVLTSYGAAGVKIKASTSASGITRSDATLFPQTGAFRISHGSGIVYTKSIAIIPRQINNVELTQITS